MLLHSGARWMVGLSAVAAALAMAVTPRVAAAAPVQGSVLAGADARPLCTLEGVPLAGFGGGKRRKSGVPWFDGYTFFFNPSEGTHDPVRVKSLVLQVEGNEGAVPFAIVSVDAVGVSVNVIEAVADRVQALGLHRNNILIVGTHTHSGPGALSDRVFWQIAAVDRLHPDVFGDVVQNIAQSIHAAAGKLRPARIGVGVGEQTDISNNRRHEGGAVDPRVGLIKVEGEDGEPIAAVFNFAVHGTCQGGDNMLMSADNMGYAERWVEQSLPGAVALFTNAAEGDVSPTRGGWEGAQFVGETLGARVEEIWRATDTDPRLTFEVQTRIIPLPPLDVNVGACDAALQTFLNGWMLSLPGPVAETEELFMAVRLNDAALVSVPGEALTEIGYAIQNQIGVRGFDPVMVMGLANGYMGYIVTPAEYDLGGYEACGSLHGPNAGTNVLESTLQVGFALASPEAWDGGPDAGLVPDAVPEAAPEASAPLDASSENDARDGSAGSEDVEQLAEASPPSSAPPPAGEESGCGCVAAGARTANHQARVSLLAAMALLLIRRRLRLASNP